MFPRIIAAIAALELVVVPVAGSSARVVCGRPSAQELARLPVEWPAFNRAIHRTFGPEWLEAAIVSYGESRWTPGAANGQYRGYFQMGAHERASTGWSSDAAGQVRAASLLNDETGGDWSPWDCRP